MGLNNSGLLLQAEVWLVVGLIGRGSGWFWGESSVGAWAGLEAGVGLNSGGVGLRLTDFKLSLRGMQGVTERNSLNWLFGVSCMVFGLSSCVWGGSDSISNMDQFKEHVCCSMGPSGGLIM